MRTEDILMGVFALLIGIGALIWFIHQRRARREAVSRAASAHGWELIDEEARLLAGQLEGSRLLKNHGKIRNPVRVPDERHPIILFDFGYTVGTGKSSRTYEQTVAAFSPKPGSLPDFRLEPKQQPDLLDKILVKLTRNKAAPTTGHEGLDELYELHTEAENSAALVPEALANELLRLQKRLTLEKTDGWVMLYRTRGFVPGEELEIFADEARRIAKSFR